MYYKGLQLCFPKSCNEKMVFSYWTRYIVDWARPKKRTGNYYLKRSCILQDVPEHKVIKKSPDYIIWKDDWGRWNFICSDFLIGGVFMASRLKDYTGNKFNHLTIIKELGGGKVLCKCDCDCGTEVIKYKEAVIKGELISCGCITRNGVNRDLSGQRFGKLTAIKPVDEKYYKFHCRCDCGNIIEAEKYNVLSGHTKSCGCLKKKQKPILNNISGTEKILNKYFVINGMVKSCGCLRKELAKELTKKRKRKQKEQE